MNAYCKVLDIGVPSLAAVNGHAEANTFSLLIVALLEHGAPLTLLEVAERFDDAGVAPVDVALRSLQRCRPNRVPVVRDGDNYALDAHNKELDFWAFRLGLRPPRVPHLRVEPPEPVRPAATTPLSVAEITEAFRDAYLFSWSAVRLAAAILDAHGGRLQAGAVVALLNGLTKQHRLQEASARHWRDTLVRPGSDGEWSLDAMHYALAETRHAVRDRIVSARRERAYSMLPEQIAANQRRREEARAANAASLAALRRVLVHAFPPERPEIVMLVDAAWENVATFTRDTLPAALECLAEYDLIGGVDVRGVLRALGFDPGDRRLAELGPPQQTITRPRGRPLRITVPLLVESSCGLTPFTDPVRLRKELAEGKTLKVRRRIEAEARALHALYEYGRLHGAVRLHSRTLDEMLPVPWVHPDEPTLDDLKRQALAQNRRIIAIVGVARTNGNPWMGAIPLTVVPHGYSGFLVDENDYDIDETWIQRARLAME